MTDRAEVVGFYAVDEVVGTCHDFSGKEIQSQCCKYLVDGGQPRDAEVLLSFVFYGIRKK